METESSPTTSHETWSRDENNIAAEAGTYDVHIPINQEELDKLTKTFTERYSTHITNMIKKGGKYERALGGPEILIDGTLEGFEKKNMLMQPGDPNIVGETVLPIVAEAIKEGLEPGLQILEQELASAKETENTQAILEVLDRINVMEKIVDKFNISIPEGTSSPTSLREEAEAATRKIDEDAIDQQRSIIRKIA